MSPGGPEEGEVDARCIDAGPGTPEKLIATVAEEINADLLIIARVARPESTGVLGDTARKVIDEIDTDVLVLPMAGG